MRNCTSASRSLPNRADFSREDQLSRMELPSGRVVEYSRDGVRRLLGLQAQLNGERQPIVSELRYRGDNRMRSYRYGNGQQDRRSYDRQGRLLVQRLAGAEDLQTDARSYRYDANGNIVELNGSYERNRYAYDALDRLHSDRIEEEAAQGYTYDLNGNRLGAPVEEDDTRYDYLAGSNRLQASEELRGSEAASFAPRADRRLEYNDAGRLWRLYEGEGADKPLRAEYIYNGIGQRTRKIVHEAEGRRRTTIYHYDLQGMLITETRADGSVLRDYLWANAQPVAQIDKQAEQERITYLYPDHLMTTRLGMDEIGTVVWRWEGEAFGQSGAEQDPDGDGREVIMRLRFPGQYHDTESDLYYNWNRYYDPSIGRYITSDVIGLEGGMNTYVYANNNSLRFMDPMGKAPAEGYVDEDPDIVEYRDKRIARCISEGKKEKDTVVGEKKCKSCCGNWFLDPWTLNPKKLRIRLAYLTGHINVCRTACDSAKPVQEHGRLKWDFMFNVEF